MSSQHGGLETALVANPHPVVVRLPAIMSSQLTDATKRCAIRVVVLHDPAAGTTGLRDAWLAHLGSGGGVVFDPPPEAELDAESNRDGAAGAASRIVASTWPMTMLGQRARRWRSTLRKPP